VLARFPCQNKVYCLLEGRDHGDSRGLLYIYLIWCGILFPIAFACIQRSMLSRRKLAKGHRGDALADVGIIPF